MLGRAFRALLALTPYCAKSAEHMKGGEAKARRWPTLASIGFGLTVLCSDYSLEIFLQNVHVQKFPNRR